MRLDSCNDHYIDMNRFGDLFSDKIQKTNIESLKNSARDGCLQSVELLYNIALRQDEYGQLAEEILFELFIGNTASDFKSDVSKNVQDSALMLYHLSVNDNMKKNTDMHKLRTPSKLLFIAGATANLDEKNALSNIFTQQQRESFQYTSHTDKHTAQTVITDDAAEHDADIWNRARMMTTDEVDMGIKLYTEYSQPLEINYPIGLINPYSRENTLAEQIKEQKKNNSFLSKPEFFPINTGDHWVVFGLFKTGDNTNPKAVVFNTANRLTPIVKRNIREAANIAGVIEPKDITFLEKHIQRNVPNGCGLFTIEAMRLLAENDFQSPVQVLQNFMSSFTQLTPEEQELYNLHNRYRIYAETYLQ